MSRRLFDVLIAVVALSLLSPILVLCVAALVTRKEGPVFWFTPRVGRNGKLFAFSGFRAMRGEFGAPTETQRFTTLGRFLRNCSLDHLPLLFNVLHGEMSVVGPRPSEPEVVDLDDPVWQEVLSVKPGLLSYAVLTLAKGYNSTPWADRTGLEREYVRGQSLGRDLSLLWRGLGAFILSAGNVKARGKPALEGR